ncbi:MAG: septal ring lytic transglycosylase RlpA family protein [Alphaproteobacteria bacterium]|nr:septal ring lytic transglycosylase RlpA family protein [Alphaproteobacteria bacterium]
MNLSKTIAFVTTIGLLGGLSACTASSPDITDPPQKQAAAIINQGGVYKVGKPYKILGRWYYPKEDYNYSEVGTASWYGPDFHSKRTANGEKYDMHSLTAAHRTLPLPSIVRVTNLENGRSLVVRVNDRGPYARNRIIDVSKKVAQLLGFLEQGTAKVRVEVLEKESKNLKAALTGSPAYADVNAAPVAKINSSQISPIAGSTVAAKTTPSGENKNGYGNFVPDYDYDPDKPLKTPQISVSASKPSAAKSTSNNGFYVQAGAFTNKDSAQSLSKRLQKFGDAQIVPAEINGRLFYRVRVGPYSGQQQALAAQAKIRNYGISAAHIVEN